MRISILGSTGSIGRQTLDVARNLAGCEVVALTANSSIDLLAKQTAEFRPSLVVCGDAAGAKELQSRLGRGIEIMHGMDGLIAAANISETDTVVNALVGNIGLKPTHSAILAGKKIALANKETLVTAGELLMPMLAANNAEILPVDSEHSAIFQCLQGAANNPIRRLILAGSGGPFRGMTAAQLENVTIDQALAHPKWSMGKKISIDSATLMNKGLEAIEAARLFAMPAEKIHVVIHPQSIIHSAIEFDDGAILAQMSFPDMTQPIQYALTYPNRHPLPSPQYLDLFAQNLTFQPPDTQTFPCLALALDALKTGGYMPTVLNAANEVAVDKFLSGQLDFNNIPKFVESAMNDFAKKTNIDELIIDNILTIDHFYRHEHFNRSEG